MCVCACVRACVCGCVRVCVCAPACVHLFAQVATSIKGSYVAVIAGNSGAASIVCSGSLNSTDMNSPAVSAATNVDIGNQFYVTGAVRANIPLGHLLPETLMHALMQMIGPLLALCTWFHPVCVVCSVCCPFSKVQLLSNSSRFARAVNNLHLHRCGLCLPLLPWSQSLMQRTFQSLETLLALEGATVRLQVTSAELNVFGLTVNLNQGDGNAYIPESNRCLLFETRLPSITP